MNEKLVTVLKDYVEGRLKRADWLVWWEEHAEEIEAQCDRYTFLRLKKRGFAGAVSILQQLSYPVKQVTGFCRECGEPLFTAMPGTTSLQEILEFAKSSHLANRERVLRDKWIHPGQYCPNGCTVILWNIKQS